MYDIPFDRSFLQLSNGIRHVMPSTDTKPELTAKALMAQPVSQPAVYANGLMALHKKTNAVSNLWLYIKFHVNLGSNLGRWNFWSCFSKILKVALKSVGNKKHF
jgi:hypothetical protein